MTTLAGIAAYGTCERSGDLVAVSSAKVSVITSILGDRYSNKIYLVDFSNNRVRTMFDVAYPTGQPSDSTSQFHSSQPTAWSSTQPSA